MAHPSRHHLVDCGFQLVQANPTCKDLTIKLMKNLIGAVREGRREQASRKNTEEQKRPSRTREGQAVLVSLDPNLSPQLVQQGSHKYFSTLDRHPRKLKEANESAFFCFFLTIASTPGHAQNITRSLWCILTL